MSKKKESINILLKGHATNLTDWNFHEVIEVLHEWADRFNDEFVLRIVTPAIQIDWLRRSRMAHYRPGRNGFGLCHEIAVNACHLGLPLVEHLATLLHELLHEWQEMHGKSGQGRYHNKQFREMAHSYGLIIDERGRRLAVQAGLFTKLLEKYQVDTSAILLAQEVPVRLHHLGQSKLKKWSCGCTNVRCAVELEAKCLQCGELFKPADPLW